MVLGAFGPLYDGGDVAVPHEVLATRWQLPRFACGKILLTLLRRGIVQLDRTQQLQVASWPYLDTANPRNSFYSEVRLAEAALIPTSA